MKGDRAFNKIRGIREYCPLIHCKSCYVYNVCWVSTLNVDILLVWEVTGISIVGYFCVKFKLSPAGSCGPRRFSGQNRIWNWSLFLDLWDICGILRELMVWFLPSFYHDNCIILWLGCFPLYLNAFMLIFCSAHVIRLFGRCWRFLGCCFR